MNFEKWFTYFLQGRTQIPQHFSIPLKFFSASRISALIWSIPSSTRSNCSVEYCDQTQTKNALKWKAINLKNEVLTEINENIFYLLKWMELEELKRGEKKKHWDILERMKKQFNNKN